ncbi:small hydrophilic protein [Streptomyces sedi]|uniref:Small hydrophilic protein n=1 Tax=Streptomyces sedi TaxID=555059 RepID=A0A5C4UYS2_9ACTN|nr:small hydrophilic protein [Streptomyces sedi]TNM28737.1 small hydrophilic protein [Streptomyces sedi]
MAFSHRLAVLAAVVLIPVTIAGASHVLGDDTSSPDVAPDVRLREPSEPAPSASTPPSEPPREDVAPRPRASETSLHDDERPPGQDAPDDDDRWDDDGDDGDDD